MSVFKSFVATSALTVFLAACGEDTDGTAKVGSLLDKASNTVASVADTVTNSDALNGETVQGIIASLNTQPNFQGIVTSLTPLFESAVQAQGTEGKQQTADIINQFKEQLPAIQAYQAKLLNKHFTAEQLEAISAFTTTETGQKFVEKMPLIQAQTESFALEQANIVISEATGQQPDTTAYSDTSTPENAEEDNQGLLQKTMDRVNNAGSAIGGAIDSTTETLEEWVK